MLDSKFTLRYVFLFGGVGLINIASIYLLCLNESALTCYSILKYVFYRLTILDYIEEH